ncbi:MAG: Hsp20/alpha crystallin family protein [Pseudomonadota bacterium]
MAKKAIEEKPVQIPSRAAGMLMHPFEEMERIMEGVFPRGWLARPAWVDMLRHVEEQVPKMDVLDREEEIVVRAEVPGMGKDELEVSVMGDVLSIRGVSRHEQVEDEKGRYHRREISSRAFERSVVLPAAVDADKAVSSFKDGMLELTLPKKEKVSRHTISLG